MNYSSEDGEKIIEKYSRVDKTNFIRSYTQTFRDWGRIVGLFIFFCFAFYIIDTWIPWDSKWIVLFYVLMFLAILIGMTSAGLLVYIIIPILISVLKFIEGICVIILLFPQFILASMCQYLEKEFLTNKKNKQNEERHLHQDSN